MGAAALRCGGSLWVPRCFPERRSQAPFASPAPIARRMRSSSFSPSACKTHRQHKTQRVRAIARTHAPRRNQPPARRAHRLRPSTIQPCWRSRTPAAMHRREEPRPDAVPGGPLRRPAGRSRWRSPADSAGRACGPPLAPRPGRSSSRRAYSSPGCAPGRLARPARTQRLLSGGRPVPPGSLDSDPGSPLRT